ncbi:hypothetical protein RMATCC62417_03871 [Rhizopus microsporus]|nr:hypothetical protein RMATCC62417_03871 [Rhizopus microsporus]
MTIGNNNNNFLDNYARIFKLYETNNGHDIAMKYASLNLDDKDMFRQTENNTWKLIDAIISSKDKCCLFQYAALKDWISKTTVSQELRNQIMRKVSEEEELEEELMHIVYRNQALSHPSKKRKVSIDIEAVYKQRWNKIRSGVYEKTIGEPGEDPTAVYVHNEYVRFNLFALGRDSSGYSQKEWDSWFECVQYMAKNESLGFYEKLLYDAFAGNTHIGPSICQTWEDVIWVNLNSVVQSAMTKQDSEKLILSDSVAQLALSKDYLLEEGDPRRFFHLVQLALLQDRISDLIDTAYEHFITRNSFFNLGKEHRIEALRFISTLLIYGRQYLDWKQDEKSIAIVSYYAELSSARDYFWPLITAIYASKLPLDAQVSVYSRFLEEFDGDKEEVSILLLLGKQQGLAMNDILKQVSSNTLQKALYESSKVKSLQNYRLENDEMDDFAYTLLDALGWLKSQDLCLELFKTANVIIRQILGMRRLYLVEKVTDVVEEMEMYCSKTKDMEKEFAEYLSHKRLVNTFKLFEEWTDLIQSSPQDSGSLSDLQKVVSWRHEVQTQTEILERELRFLLEGGWLGEHTDETRHISKATLREIYIPDLVIKYHQLLHLSSSVIPENLQKSRQMNTYVTVKHRELYDDIMVANRMKQVIKEFSKSLLPMNQ